MENESNIDIVILYYTHYIVFIFCDIYERKPVERKPCEPFERKPYEPYERKPCEQFL